MYFYVCFLWNPGLCECWVLGRYSVLKYISFIFLIYLLYVMHVCILLCSVHAKVEARVWLWVSYWNSFVCDIQTPIPGVTSVCHYTQLFMWVWNISTQVFTLAQQAAYSLRRLLSPSFIFQLWFCNKSARRFGWGCLCLIGMLTGSSVLAKVIVCSQKDSIPTWATEHINV